MNSQSYNSRADTSKSLEKSGRLGEPAAEKQEYNSSPELWEPPFERWLKLADDLLRDWPAPPSRARDCFPNSENSRVRVP